MSGFTKRNLEQRLVKDLVAEASQIKAIRIWFLSHKLHYQAIVRIWFKELVKTSQDKKLAFMYLAYDVIRHSIKECPEFVTEFAMCMKKVFEHLVTVNLDTKVIVKIVELIKIWRKGQIFDQETQGAIEKIWKYGPADDVIVTKEVKKDYNWINKLPPLLTCSVCSNLLKEPVQFPCCKASLCKLCAFVELEKQNGCWFAFCPKPALMEKKDLNISTELAIQVDLWKIQNKQFRDNSDATEVKDEKNVDIQMKVEQNVDVQVKDEKIVDVKVHVMPLKEYIEDDLKSDEKECEESPREAMCEVDYTSSDPPDAYLFREAFEKHPKTVSVVNSQIFNELEKNIQTEIERQLQKNAHPTENVSEETPIFLFLIFQNHNFNKFQDLCQHLNRFQVFQLKIKTVRVPGRVKNASFNYCLLEFYSEQECLKAKNILEKIEFKSEELFSKVKQLGSKIQNINTEESNENCVNCSQDSSSINVNSKYQSQEDDRVKWVDENANQVDDAYIIDEDDIIKVKSYEGKGRSGNDENDEVTEEMNFNSENMEEKYKQLKSKKQCLRKADVVQEQERYPCAQHWICEQNGGPGCLLKWINQPVEKEQSLVSVEESTERGAMKRNLQFDGECQKKSSKIFKQNSNEIEGEKRLKDMIEWVKVCGDETEEPINIATENDGTLLLSSIRSHFPGTVGLKYRNPGTNCFHGVGHKGGSLFAPRESGWTGLIFVSVRPNYMKLTKNLVVLGLSSATTEEDVEKYFERFGDILMVHIRKEQNCFAVIRFAKKEVELAVISQTHMIDARWCSVGYAGSYEADRLSYDKTPQKVFIGGVTEALTSEDLRQYFKTFGHVAGVHFPQPRQNFAFVHFSDKKVAMSLRTAQHTIKGVSVRVRKTKNIEVIHETAQITKECEDTQETTKEMKFGKQNMTNGERSGIAGISDDTNAKAKFIDIPKRNTELVKVCGDETEEPINIARENDGTLLLSSITSKFPGTTGLKYRNPRTNVFQSVRHQCGIFFAPNKDGWDGLTLVCVRPNLIKLTKNLVIRGLSFNTSEEDILKHFEKFGEVLMVHLQKGPDCLAFIRFAAKAAELAVISQTHIMDSQWCYVGYSGSQGVDGSEDDENHGESFVDAVTEAVTYKDLSMYLETFGTVMDVQFCQPCKNFAFVQFRGRKVAMSLRTTQHFLKDAKMRDGLYVNYEKAGLIAKQYEEATKVKEGQASQKVKQHENASSANAKKS